MGLGEKLHSAMEVLRSGKIDSETIKEAVKEIQRALIAADVEVQLVLDLTKKIEAEAFKELPKGLTRREHVLKITYDLLVELIGGTAQNAPEKPRKILLVGLYGQGKCVHPETIVPLAEGTIASIKELYDSTQGKEEEIPEEGFVKEIEPKKIFALNPVSLKIVETEASHVWKLKKTEPLIKISLDNGNNHKISTTPEHPFFVLQDGFIKQIKADELKVGQFVATPKKINFETKHPLKNDFFEKMPPDTHIINKKISEYAKQKMIEKYGTLIKGFKELNFLGAYCTFTWKLKRGIISLETTRKIGIRSEDIEDFVGLCFGKSLKRKINVPLLLSEDFAEFLGYLFGDGYVYHGYVEITNEDKEIIQRIASISESLFGKKAKIKKEKRSENLFKVQIASKNLVNFLHNAIGIPIKKKSDKIRIPKAVLNAGEKEKALFLRAYFDCDGYIALNQRAIEFATASKGFAEDLGLLLLGFGLCASYAKKIIKNKPYYLLRLKSKDAEIFAEKIGSIVPFKQERLKECKRIGLTQGFGKHELLHTGNLLKETREYFGATIGEIQKHVNSYGFHEKRGIISRNALRKFLHCIKKTKNKNNELLKLATQGIELNKLCQQIKEHKGWINACIYRLKKLDLVEYKAETVKTNQNGLALLEKQALFDENKLTMLELLANSEIAWFKINKIELDESTEFVYDLTVPEYHNFVANGIIVHNTTTVSKLAKYYSKRGLKVGIVCADSFRAAAFEQLKQLAEKIKIPFYGNAKEKKAEKIVQESLKAFAGFDLVIVDSAGRDAFNAELVNEIKAINNVFKPEQKWLVIGADVGQLAKKQAIAFHDAVGVNGMIITRMDGSAKGGGALSACNVAKCPVYFIGIGEKVDDLEEFSAQRFLSRVMGYGDLQGLLEKAKELSEEEELSPEELLQGEFNLETFYQQLKATKKMGSIGKVAEMLGLKMQIPKEILETTEEKLEVFKIIMDSMTKQEKQNPDVLNHKRIERIAKGSGKSEAQVRELLKQFKQMQKVFKKFKGLDEEKLERMQKSGKFDLGKMLQGFAPKKKQKFKIR